MDLLTVNEAADILHVSAPTVRRFVASGRLPAVHVGRSLRIERTALGSVVQPIQVNGRSRHALNPAEEKPDIWANYDPKKVREALEALREAFVGVDLKELERDIYAARGHVDWER